MKVIVFGKSNRPRGPRPVEMINFNKIYSSKESENNGRLMASKLAFSVWFHTGIYFVKIDHLNWSRAPRSITFIKDNYFHALTVSFCEKYFSFSILGDAFFGTPGILAKSQAFQIGMV